jgi:hypothetical protein
VKKARPLVDEFDSHKGILQHRSGGPGAPQHFGFILVFQGRFLLGAIPSVNWSFILIFEAIEIYHVPHKSYGVVSFIARKK